MGGRVLISDMVKKVVVIKASETRLDSHSEYALDRLVEVLRKSSQPDGMVLQVRAYHLADHLTEIPNPQTADAPLPPGLEAVVHDFFDNDLLLIGVPNKNFAPSVLLQTFFQKMRPRLMSLDKQGNIVSRNWTGNKVGIVLTGRSSYLKYLLLNQFVFFVQFDLLFDFWGKEFNHNLLRILFGPQNRVVKTYIPDCRGSTFKDRAAEITARMEKFAVKVQKLLHY
jgi:hypothetical protein